MQSTHKRVTRKRKTRKRQVRKAAAPPPVQVVDRQVIVRHPERCAACGGINSFRQTGGFRTFGNQTVASARCRDCGALAQIRKN